MMLTSQQVETLRQVVHEAFTVLHNERIHTVSIAEFVPERRRWLFRRKAVFREIDRGWPLGLFLIGTDEGLWSVGETTRAVPPGHPGHVSAERERRREYTRIAHESGFPHGEIVYFDSVPIPLTADVDLPDTTPLTVTDGALGVHWARSSPGAIPIPLETYIREQVSLALSRSS